MLAVRADWPRICNQVRYRFADISSSILDRQGKHAAGGAMAYIVDGKMTKGFAFVAYPAAYRDSGVMTFMVGQDGVVYEEDLGKETEERVKSMTTFDPDSSWKKSPEPQQTADNQKSQ